MKVEFTVILPEFWLRGEVNGTKSRRERIQQKAIAKKYNNNNDDDVVVDDGYVAVAWRRLFGCNATHYNSIDTQIHCFSFLLHLM